MKKSIKILSINILGDESGAILTEATKGNPSGVFKQTAGQLRRLAERAGVYSVQALKHLVELGQSTLEADEVECKAGEEFENRDGSKGKYTKDHIQYQNTEIKLGFTAKMKVAEIAFKYAMENRQPVAIAPKQAEVVAEAPKVA